MGEKIPKQRKGGQTGGGGRIGQGQNRSRSQSRGGRPHAGGGGTGKTPGKSSFASPEMQKAVYLTAAIPVLAVVGVAVYFVRAAVGS